MILQALAATKSGMHFTPKEILESAAEFDKFVDGIAGRDPRRVAVVRFGDAGRTLQNDLAYKFTDEQGLAYWQKGSILLRPIAEYVRIENPGSRDLYEGQGHLYLNGGSRSMQMLSLSGFNSVVLCTSADARKSERGHRHAAFGKHLLRINSASEFAEKIATRLKAVRHTVRDVVYSDVKAVVAESPHVEDWVAMNGTGDMKMEFLHHLADHHLDELIDATAAASVFSKPNKHWLERERRFHFLLPHDVESPIAVEGEELREHIEVLT